ncbi:Putative flippase GtrA (transmembrane translocase of bactoprenol-linked glucose) [Nocardioides alpinus]|uniref:GtrA family protein n=1 Tax=Nocardioides alpinus TaxID=748909 RepID=A0A1I0Y081_9ACTN|nr:GtrA family protein [Nocardioides alpinus]PKH42750.1 GtrA family protein [Nocardioides alpinus]SFB06297.1 Putative flippase GtrA (transmembrane translocase of bactoprenol-linked glucose) [Nocardioides alpinus]
MPSRGSALLTRHRRNFGLLFRFVLVGASGVLVNLLTLVVLRKLGPHFDDAVIGLGTSDFNVRWYHVYSTIAFFVANLSNFQLNRTWTFRSTRASRWWTEYWPFLVVGLGGQVVGLALLTLLMHPGSPVGLPTSVFDDSTGLRTRLYWAQLVVIVLVTPLSFVLNKLWTFAAVRTGHPDLADPLREDEVLAEDEVV